MAQKAARTTDFHSCPQTAPIPHVGGPVTAPCDGTVLIEGLPAARFTDLAACAGPVDAIAIGSSGCLIGNLLAARVGDASTHGGVIVAGAGEVLIGEAPGNVELIRRGNIYLIVDHTNHRIVMVGVQEYAGDGASPDYAQRAAQQINETWSGQTTYNGETYDVESHIQGRQRETSNEANPATNQINVAETNVPPGVHRNTDPANQHLYGRGPGYQHSNEDTDGGRTISHEFGHAMGLQDEYVEGPRGPNGERTITRTGPEGGIMGDVSSNARPTSDNFNSLITGDGLAP